jgi:DNA-binding transcriptional MerR regulator
VTSLSVALGSIMLSVTTPSGPPIGARREAVSWSTRELAELANTTVNTIRHYHRIGLLREPERRYNGYKQYGVRDLICLLRILRLVGLGVHLADVREMTAGGDDTVATLQAVDADLSSRIARLQQARDDIAAIMQGSAPPDAPLGFVSIASQLTDADLSILHLSNQLYDDDARADLQRMVALETDAGTLGKEIAALAATADEATRQRLADSLAPILVQNLVDYPWLMNPSRHLAKGERVTRATFAEAFGALYNAAQRDVLSRAGLLAHEQLQTDEWRQECRTSRPTLDSVATT